MTLPEARARAEAGEPFGALYRQLGTAWRPAFKEWWLRSATVPNRGARNGKAREGEPWPRPASGTDGETSGG